MREDLFSEHLYYLTGLQSWYYWTCTIAIWVFCTSKKRVIVNWINISAHTMAQPYQDFLLPMEQPMVWGPSEGSPSTILGHFENIFWYALRRYLYSKQWQWVRKVIWPTCFENSWLSSGWLLVGCSTSIWSSTTASKTSSECSFGSLLVSITGMGAG